MRIWSVTFDDNGVSKSERVEADSITEDNYSSCFLRFKKKDESTVALFHVARVISVVEILS